MDNQILDPQIPLETNTITKNNNSWLFLPLVGIVMLLVGLAGGYFLFCNYAKSSKLTSNRDVNTTPTEVLTTPTPGPVEIVSWNTLRNQNSKFELKYPGVSYETLNSKGRTGFNNLTDNTNSFNVEFNYTFTSNDVKTVIPPSGASSMGALEYILSISIEKNTNKTLESIVSGAKKSYGTRQLFSTQELFVDNTPAIRINDVAMDTPTDEVCMIKFNNLYCIQAKYYIDTKLYGSSEKYQVGNRIFSSVVESFRFL